MREACGQGKEEGQRKRCKGKNGCCLGHLFRRKRNCGIRREE